MGKVVHFEIPTDDSKRAQDFYNQVFDWKINTTDFEGYAIVHTGPTDPQGMNQEPGFINGGLTKRGQPVEHPVVTIDVESIEEASKKIEAAGGKMTQERLPVGDMGFTAYFTDCEGNLMGLWETAKK